MVKAQVVLTSFFSFILEFEAASMEKVCALIGQGYLDIFSIFSLGLKVKSPSILQFCLLFFNMLIPLTILSVYVSKGSLFVSSDALSKATDIFELFVPISIHMFVVCINLKKQKIFNEVKTLMEYFDETFHVLNADFFKKAKRSSTFRFTIKFLMVHVLGLGIDVFLLISLLPRNESWQNAIRTRVISLNILRLISTQFIFHCDYVNSRIRCFNNEVEDAAKNCKQSKEKFLAKLRALKVLDLKFIELLLLIREYFKWFLLLNISCDIIIIVIDIYWIYGGLMFGNNPFFIRKPLNNLFSQ